MEATTEQQNNKRIAKNTIALYFRTIVTMAISLFTSRIVLDALGVDDFGIYNVVGGVVAMFSVISGALSSSISRFLTFQLGKNYDVDKLRKIFSTGVNIQIGISCLVLILGEVVGLWFLNYKMNIPIERVYAANWVLQCALLTFIIGLISVPYNAAIIAHEKMTAFAYIGILEVSLKLVVAYLLYVLLMDKLIVYSILLVCVSAIIRLTYGIYCRRKFNEARYQWVYDPPLMKEMTGFAGWNFFTNGAYIFNTQGVNILINLFFGVGINAARGVANQVEMAIKKFVFDFTTAINPQIIKNYASGNYEFMYKLICRGSKFSYLLMLCLSIPFLFETSTVFKLWLTNVPAHAESFFRLTVLCTLVDMLGNTGYTACMATGKIKKYVLIISSIGCLVFPLTFVAYKLGARVECCYIIFCVIYLIIDIVRLNLMKKMVGFPPMLFVKKVVAHIVPVTAVSVVVPSLVIYFFEPSLKRFLLNGIISFCCALMASFFFGLDAHERKVISDKIVARFK